MGFDRLRQRCRPKVYTYEQVEELPNNRTIVLGSMLDWRRPVALFLSPLHGQRRPQSVLWPCSITAYELPRGLMWHEVYMDFKCDGALRQQITLRCDPVTDHFIAITFRFSLLVPHLQIDATHTPFVNPSLHGSGSFLLSLLPTPPGWVLI